MIVLRLRAVAQGIEVIDASDFVSGSVKVYQAVFEFDSNWDGFAKTAVFEAVGRSKTDMLITDGMCEIPHECLEQPGYLRVGVYGVHEDQIMPTVWSPVLEIEEGATAGEMHFDPTPSTYAQILALLAGFAGGTAGKIMAKHSDVNYDVEWVDDPSGGIQAVKYVPQELTDTDKANARDNIGAAPAVIPDSTPGNIGIIGSNGNIADSGVSKDNLILAPQLASNNIKTDAVPYVYRQTGGGIGTGNREYDSIVGGSVVHHQLLNPDRANFELYGVTVTNNGDGSYTFNGTATQRIGLQLMQAVYKIIPNHVYYASGYKKVGSNSGFFGFGGSPIDRGGGGMAKYSSNANTYFRVDAFANDTFDNTTMAIVVYDLTEMFGSAVADRLLAMETASAGSGVAVLNAMGLDKYRPYTATPSLESVSGLQSHKTVGFNLWDGVIENGGINDSTGQNATASTQNRSKNYIPVVSNTTYYICTPNIGAGGIYGYWYDASYNFIGRARYNSSYDLKNGTTTSPANARYMRFKLQPTTYDVSQICINISDPARNGTYEPYEEHTYPLDDSLTLRGVPVLDANNNIAWDGDIYHADGTVQRKYNIVDMGTLNWLAAGAGYYVTLSDSKSASNKLICPNYTWGQFIVSTSELASLDDKKIYRQPSNTNVFIKDTSYETAAAFKTAMSGVYLVYELATPTTETAEPYESLQICDPLGTEEYVTTGICPVGHSTRYPENQVAKLDGLPSNFSTLIAPTEATYKATRAYTTGRLLIVNNVLYKATTSIASGATLTVGTNITATTLDEVIASFYERRKK